MNVLSLFDGISGARLALERCGIKVDNYYASEVDKYAIQIAMKNYPDTKQVGDVTKVKRSDLPRIDLLVGGSPCFTEGNCVFTDKGYVDIKNINIGDNVLTHKGRYRKVLMVGNEMKETVILKSQGNIETKTTENHPYYCTTKKLSWDNDMRNYHAEYSDFSWKAISEFTENDKAVSIKLNSEIDIELSDIDLYILGRFLADGCCYKTKRKGGKNSFIYRKDLVELGEKFGKGVSNKFIPNFILNLPVKRLKIFLQGYFDGDGNTKGDHKRITTVSKKLALTLSLAIQKCFYGVSIYKNNRPKTAVIEGRTVNQKEDYQITYTEKKNDKSKFFVKDDYVCYNIDKYKKTGDKELVYNIEVEEDNSYIVNNLIVHNCQGFSFAGKQLNFEDERSKLFFEYARLLKECKPTYFLLENVKMKKEYQDVISEILGVEPIEINSSLISAQNRKRLYWTNIHGVVQPEDKGIFLKDVVHENEVIETVLDGNYAEWFAKNAEFQLGKKYCSLSPDKAITLTARQYASWNGNYWFEKLNKYIVPFDETLQILNKEVERGKVGYFRKDSQANRVYYIHGKAITLCGEAGGGAGKMGQYLFGCITPDRINKRQNGQRFNDGKKFYTLTAQDQHGVLVEGYIRKLTPIECERLQTFPDGWTECEKVSNAQRYRALGNSFTVNVIKHIFSFIK